MFSVFLKKQKTVPGNLIPSWYTLQLLYLPLLTCLIFIDMSHIDAFKRICIQHEERIIILSFLQL